MKWVGALVAMLTLLGCATPQKPVATADAPSWSGRMSIKIESDPVQQTSAGFTLQGKAQAGQLDLFTPLGGKAAQIVWGTGFANIDDGKTKRLYPDLAAALLETTGTDIPISYLFDWLQGKQDKALEASMGWEADLTRLADGRIFAARLQPLPRIELRVVLEQ